MFLSGVDIFGYVIPEIDLGAPLLLLGNTSAIYFGRKHTDSKKNGG
jgi:hypothetical protein